MSQPLTRLLTSHPCEFPTPATKLRLELWEKTREFGFVFQDTATTTAARASVTPGSLDLTAHAIRRTWPTASRSLSIAQTPSPTWSATTGGNANAATAFASERYIGEKERFQPWQFSCLSDFGAKVFLVEKFCVWIVILLFFLSQQPDKKIDGKYCECDNTTCDRVDGKICNSEFAVAKYFLLDLLKEQHLCILNLAKAVKIMPSRLFCNCLNGD